MTLTLDEAIARVPFLANTAGLKVTSLSGGITNLNYKIEAGDLACVLRITGEGSEMLGIRRDVEYAANLAAGKLGVAPEVLYFIQPEGYLVTRFIHGALVPPEEMVEPENIRSVVEKLRKFHTQGPHLDGEFNGFRRIELLAAVSRRYHSPFPHDFDWIMARLGEVEAALMKHPYTPTPCHNDLLNLNFLKENGDIRILDWEYAGMGDIFFDLSNFSHHHLFYDEQINLLLQAYFGEATPQRYARLRLMWAMADVYEAMWGVTQIGISKLDEDFQGYADLFFGRARQWLRDPRYGQWLVEVASSA